MNNAGTTQAIFHSFPSPKRSAARNFFALRGAFDAEIMKQFLAVLMCFIMACVAGIGSVAAQDKVIVPNMAGIPQDVAAHQLQIAGLKPVVQFDRNRSTIVTQQRPQPGTLVPFGSEVIIATGVITTQIQTLAKPQDASRSQIQGGERDRGVDRPISMQAQPQQASMRRTTATPALAWYPRRFLESNTARIQNIPQTRTPSADTSNILQARPFLYRENKPVILRSVRGWQEGWHTQGNASGGQAVSTIESAQPENNSAQEGQEGRSRIFSIFRIFRSDAQPTANVSTGMTVVPNVLQLQQSDAAFAINKAGLRVGGLTGIADMQARSGAVVRQSPQPRALVPVGAAVQLWVAD